MKKLEIIAIGFLELNFLKTLIENAGYKVTVIENRDSIVGEIDSFNYLVSSILEKDHLWINTSYRLRAENEEKTFFVYGQHDNVIFNAIKPYDINDLTPRTFLTFSSDSNVEDIISEIKLEKSCCIRHKN